MDYLPILCSRGLSGLWSKTDNGIQFHCHQTTTSMVIGEFSAWFEGAKSENYFREVEGHAVHEEWDIFAPHGKVVELTFQDWKVLVISTWAGPLEIFSKYGTQEGFYTFPFGKTFSEGEIRPHIKEEFSSLWENVYPRMIIGDTHVDFRIHE